jgi:hypothetical protein
VFYELHAERERQGKQAEVAIVRLEQLAPFPFDLVCRELYRYVGTGSVWGFICVGTVCVFQVMAQVFDWPKRGTNPHTMWFHAM